MLAGHDFLLLDGPTSFEEGRLRMQLTTGAILRSITEADLSAASHKGVPTILNDRVPRKSPQRQSCLGAGSLDAMLRTYSLEVYPWRG